jgi:hypothetical protein
MGNTVLYTTVLYTSVLYTTVLYWIVQYADLAIQRYDIFIDAAVLS